MVRSPAVGIGRSFARSGVRLGGAAAGEFRRRDTAGEYVAVVFLRDGRLAIVTTIRDDQRKRAGVSWRSVARQ